MITAASTVLELQIYTTQVRPTIEECHSSVFQQKYLIGMNQAFKGVGCMFRSKYTKTPLCEMTRKVGKDIVLILT